MARRTPMGSWERASYALEHLPKVLLWGPPGTGKSTAARSIGVNGNGVVSVTITEEMPAASLIGHYIPSSEGAWRWMDAPGVHAWREGKRLVINEIDKSLGDVQDALHVICDDISIAEMTLPKDDLETVRPHPNFTVVATMNGTPDDLPEALVDRFTCVHIDEVAPQALKILSKDLRSAAAESAKREQGAVSIRRWKTFDDLRSAVGDQIAADVVFGPESNEILNALGLAR